MVIGAFRQAPVIEAKPFLRGPPVTDDTANPCAFVEESANADLAHVMVFGSGPGPLPPRS